MRACMTEVVGCNSVNYAPADVHDGFVDLLCIQRRVSNHSCVRNTLCQHYRSRVSFFHTLADHILSKRRT